MSTPQATYPSAGCHWSQHCRLFTRIPVESVASDAGDVQIGPSIVIEIRRAGAHAESGDPDAGQCGHVDELTLTSC